MRTEQAVVDGMAMRRIEDGAADTLVVAGVRHFVPDDHPAEVADAVRPVMDEVARR